MYHHTNCKWNLVLKLMAYTHCRQLMRNLWWRSWCHTCWWSFKQVKDLFFSFYQIILFFFFLVLQILIWNSSFDIKGRSFNLVFFYKNHIEILSCSWDLLMSYTCNIYKDTHGDDLLEFELMNGDEPKR